MTGENVASLDRSLPNLLRLTHLAFLELLERDLEQHDVSGEIWKYLRALWEEEDVGVEVLSAKLCVPTVSAHSALEQLEIRGFAVRRVQKSGNVSETIVLTEAGKKLQATLAPLAAHVVEQGLRGLSESEQQQLFALLTTVLRTLRLTMKSPKP